MYRNRSKRRQLSIFRFEISIGCYCLLVCLRLIAVWLIHAIFYVIRFTLSVCIDEGIGVEVYGQSPALHYLPCQDATAHALSETVI